jgi:hypothetical protein
MNIDIFFKTKTFVTVGRKCVTEFCSSKLFLRQAKFYHTDWVRLKLWINHGANTSWSNIHTLRCAADSANTKQHQSQFSSFNLYGQAEKQHDKIFTSRVHFGTGHAKYLFLNIFRTRGTKCVLIFEFDTLL